MSNTTTTDINTTECSDCDGYGAFSRDYSRSVWPSDPDSRACSRCHGTGKLRVVAPVISEPAPVRLICNNGLSTEIAFNYTIPAVDGEKTVEPFRGPNYNAKLTITRINEIEGGYRPAFAVSIHIVRDGSTFTGGSSAYCKTSTSLKRWITKSARELSKIYSR